MFVPYMQDFLKRELPQLRVITAPVQEPFLLV